MQHPERPKRSPRTVIESASLKPFAIGLDILSLRESQINDYGEFINNFYKEVEKQTPGRKITRDALTMMQGAVFAIGTKNQKNPEWKEHCASSLREIFHEWRGVDSFIKDFVPIFKNENGLSSYERNILKPFFDIYGYFSGIDHHTDKMTLENLKSFRKDSSITIKHCYLDEVFIDVVKDFFSILSSIIVIAKG